MEPVIAATYTFKIRLSDVAGGFKLTPTLAAGDFKISTSSIASGALTNLTNLPTETPAGSGIVVISLTAAEMTDGDPIVTWKDQTTPQEWVEGYSFIDTRPSLAAMSTAIADIPTSAESAEIEDITDAFDAIWGAAWVSAGTTAGLITTLTTEQLEHFQLTLLKGAHLATDLAVAIGRINANTGTGTGTYDNTTKSQEAIKDSIAAIPPADDTATLAAIAALNNISVSDILDAANGIETSITPRQALRLILSANVGILSGAATTSVTIRNVGDSKNRIVATVDADGNRSAVTTDAT